MAAQGSRAQGVTPRCKQAHGHETRALRRSSSIPGQGAPVCGDAGYWLINCAFDWGLATTLMFQEPLARKPSTEIAR